MNSSTQDAEKKYILTIFNRDPTLSDRIAEIHSSGTMDVGHSWIMLRNVQTSEETYFGWGPKSTASYTGATVLGEVITTKDQYQSSGPTSQYSINISQDQADKVVQYWKDLEQQNTGYSYGGRSLDPFATFCTEAVLECLEQSGILNDKEHNILKKRYDDWGGSFPTHIPAQLSELASRVRHLRSPNPNEFEERLKQLRIKNQDELLPT